MLTSGQIADHLHVAFVLLHVDVFDTQAEQVVKGFDQIDWAFLVGTCAVGGDVELVVEGFLKLLNRQQRVFAFEFEHVVHEVVVLLFGCHVLKQVGVGAR